MKCNKPPWKPKCEAPTLKQTLTSPELQQHFAEFLEGEYAEENLILWNEVEGYRKLSQMGSSPSVLREEIRRIFELYIKPDSEFEVNLPGNIPKSIEVSLETFPLNSSGASVEATALTTEEELLYEAQVEAHNLLLCHSFPRWLKSVEWAPTKVEEAPRGPPAPPPPKRSPRPPSLAITLGNPGLHRTFKKHLSTADPRMYATICLWETLEQFSAQSSSTPPTELKRGAKDIFEKYLKPGTTHFAPIKEEKRIPIGKMVYDSTSLVGFKPSMFLQVQDDAFQQLQVVYIKWCSMFGCWEGVPASSANSQVTRVNLKNSRRSIIIQRPSLPGEKQDFDGDNPPSFEQTMQNIFLRARFMDYLRALGLQNFAHFSQELEEFANNKHLSPEAVQAQACILFRKYITFKDLEAQEPVNQLPMSIREDLHARLFTSYTPGSNPCDSSSTPSTPTPSPLAPSASPNTATPTSPSSEPPALPASTSGVTRETSGRRIVTAAVFDKARVWCQHQLQGKYFELWASSIDAWRGPYPPIAKPRASVNPDSSCVSILSMPGVLLPTLASTPNKPLRPPPSTLLPVKAKTPTQANNSTDPQPPSSPVTSHYQPTTNITPRKQAPSPPTYLAPAPPHTIAQPTPEKTGLPCLISLNFNNDQQSQQQSPPRTTSTTTGNPRPTSPSSSSTSTTTHGEL
ncbi:hypothetical protein Pelo_12366 [Pelomyxa schiedti]|nr:hypothetical protein Pelo_12921 [Pelomyxa schiedti]KAH3746227.1 hypothetical protein Pelo_12366 [Pelomyxa schiedti]